jgi:hypothetical protein
MEGELVTVLVPIVWGLLLGTVASAFFIAAYKRKGRVALLMLPWVLWTLFMPLRGLIMALISTGIVEQELANGGTIGAANSRLFVVRLIFEIIPNLIWPIVWFLPLILIFKKDKPAITTTESEEPPKPVE